MNILSQTAILSPARSKSDSLLVIPFTPHRFLLLLLLVGTLGSAKIAAALSTDQERAEFLAGHPLPASSSLAALQTSNDYRQHQADLQAQWAFCKQVRYGLMEQWARNHLSRNDSTRGVVRYLFGGPDFLNAHAFFPEARVMVLGGLEPVGEVPPPESLTPDAMALGLKALRDALHTSLFCGYFITSEMKPQLLQGSFHGVLPVLLTELALTGNEILSVDLVQPFGSPGVKILYERYDPRGDTQPQTLYYFQANLSNGRECKKFLGWLGDLGDGPSYLKAASFLLPTEDFSQTRDFLLKTSTLILQDDSGIPFHDFPPSQWKIQLFGVYTEPLPIFKLHKEPELQAAYAGPDYAGPLAFGAGYHVNASDANLLLATRIDLPAAAVALPASAAPLSLPTPTPLSTPRPNPTPKPKPMRIRKALPVEVRKAVPLPTATPMETPVEIRKALPVEQPQVSSPASQPVPGQSPAPEPNLEPTEALPAASPQ